MTKTAHSAEARPKAHERLPQNPATPVKATKNKTFFLVLRDKKQHGSRPLPSTHTIRSPAKKLNQPVIAPNNKQESTINNQPINPTLYLPIDKLFEPSSHIIAHTKAFNQKDDDINRLLKKLTLGFMAKKNESEFVIKRGIFKGMRIYLYANDKDLSLEIAHGSLRAQNLIKDHRGVLKKRLACHEINLKDVRFLS